MPQLQALWEDYHEQGVEIITINIGQSLATIRPYIQGYDYIFLMDANYSTWNLYNHTNYIPLNYVLDNDEDMTVIGWMTGYNSYQIRNWLDDALMDYEPEIPWMTKSTSLPTSDDSVSVTATATDDYGVDSVKIRYTVDSTDTTFVPMSEVAPDTFQGYIPNQPDGVFVEFAVVAYDNHDPPNAGYSEIDYYFSGIVPIDRIRANDGNGNNLYVGYEVRVTGVATVSTGTFFPEGAGVDIYVQDRPTAGINVYDPQSTASVSLGDSVVAEGILEQYHANLRLTSSSGNFITVVGQGTLPEPILLTPAALADSFEGMLVRFDTMFIDFGQWPPEGYGSNLDIAAFTDTTQKTTMVIDEDTDLDGSPEPPYLFDVIGVLRQNDPALPYWGHYEVLPRGTSDIFPIGDLFTRGDADNNGVAQMADAVFILKHLYVPDSPEPACLDTGDADDDGEILMSDATFLLKHLYVPESPEPPSPYPDCGMDPTDDQLGCLNHACMP